MIVFLFLPLESSPYLSLLLFYLWYVLSGSVCVHLVWDPLCTLYLDTFFRFGKPIFFLNTVYIPLSLSSPSGICIIHSLTHFILLHRSHMLLFSFICFSVWCSDWVVSIILSLRSLIFSSSFSQLVIASRLLFISKIELTYFWFVHLCSF